ncbi:hypothetical protein MMPV_003609 [Pyropia vietnamensis]
MAHPSFLPTQKHNRVVHLKLRPFQCPEEDCGRFFSERGNLSKHVQSVHEKRRPFHCTVCERNFASLDSLKRHRLMVHQISATAALERRGGGSGDPSVGGGSGGSGSAARGGDGGGGSGGGGGGGGGGSGGGGGGGGDGDGGRGSRGGDPVA